MQQEQDGNKENEDSGEDSEGAKSRKKGAKVCICMLFLYGTLKLMGQCTPVEESTSRVHSNVQKTANIQALRDEWMCTKLEAACSGTYCYINPTTSEHVTFSHETIDVWAMGMVNFLWLIISSLSHTMTFKVESKWHGHTSCTSKQQII
jgi:hypothetical protein